MKTKILIISAAVILACGAGGVYYYSTLYGVTGGGTIDPTGDLFDKDGESATSEHYLDIIRTEVALSNNTYVVTIKVNGPLPANLTDPSVAIEWDVFIDSDMDPTTGWDWSLVLNDIGADHLLRLNWWRGGFWGQNIRTETGVGGFIGYRMDENVIELRFPKEVIGSPASFNYVMAVRKYGGTTRSAPLLVADKAPDKGHYVFHANYVEAEPPGSLKMLKSEHVTFYCINGIPTDYCDSRMEEIAEGFELAYAHMSEDFPVCPAQNFTAYVYPKQSDLVEGLKTYSYFPSESAEFFRPGGAPRPINYVMHVAPSFRWVEVAHELTHTFMEEYSGNAYESVKWLDEGIAEYEAYRFGMRTKYRLSVKMSREAHMSVVRRLFDDRLLYKLGSISTEQQWGDLMEKGFTREIYSQAFALVEYLCQAHGMDKCLKILKYVQEGQSQEQAIQSALGTSIEQIEIDFSDYLHEIFS